MPTITATGPAVTESIAIAAPPDRVHAFLADPDNLPRWAPAFAQAVEHDGDDLLVTSGDAVLRISMRASAAQGTVDVVAAADHRRGLFTRVIPNGQGSQCVLALALAAGTPDAAVTDQAAVMRTELEAIRAHVEADAP